MAIFLAILLTLVGCMLIFVILLQRGRGGGLAGALGGMGGQSAFGTKAGDVFTKITIVMAVLWVALAGITGIFMDQGEGRYTGGQAAPSEFRTQAGDEDIDNGFGELFSPPANGTTPGDDAPPQGQTPAAPPVEPNDTP